MKDERWGIGFREKDALKHGDKWGANLLGKALMRMSRKLRERIREIEEGVRTDWDLPGKEKWEAVPEA
ncbi:hypothetical protein BDZ45DRAFT_680293 [Acephala macrosclerotiorum]|nr:hypothetical protein BDZ45DRAFT_680293 [Acephala macrosclerotiorum]